MSKKQKQSTSGTSTGTATTTPNVPGYVQGPVSDYFGQVGGLLSQGPAGPSPLEQQAYDAAGGLLDTSLANTDLKPYMDPFEEEVVQRSMADLDRFRQGAISGNQSDATLSKAYGGSRHGVADAETNRGFIDQAGLLSSSLRSQGFGRAQDAARFDLSNRQGQIGLLSDLGGRQRMSDVERLRALQGLLGINPEALFGRTITEDSATTGTGKTAGNFWDFLAGGGGEGAGGLMQGAGALITAFSDARLKTDAEQIGEYDGMPVWRFRYITDKPDAPLRVGVMAQDLLARGRADAVTVADDGYYLVCYDLL